MANVCECLVNMPVGLLGLLFSIYLITLKIMEPFK